MDIQQNNYSTSIVSAQRQPLRHDFYSERSTSYACIVPIPQPHAHTSTSPHTKWSGQASKTKGQYQEKEQERKVTYRHLETQLHVKRVESKILGVNMESIVRDEQNCSLKQTNKFYPRWPKMGANRVQNQGQRPPWTSKTNKVCPGPNKNRILASGYIQDACQKGSKWDLQETPRRLKMKTINQEQKTTQVDDYLEAPKYAFEDQNECPWDTCRRT